MTIYKKDEHIVTIKLNEFESSQSLEELREFGKYANTTIVSEFYSDTDIDIEDLFDTEVIEKLEQELIPDSNDNFKILEDILGKEVATIAINNIGVVSNEIYDYIDELVEQELYLEDKIYALRDRLEYETITAYEHGGVCVYLGGSTDGFDNRMSGIIYVLKKETDDDSWRDLARKYIEEEFSELRNYVNDDIFEYYVEEYVVGDEIGMEQYSDYVWASFEDEVLKQNNLEGFTQVASVYDYDALETLSMLLQENVKEV